VKHPRPCHCEKFSKICVQKKNLHCGIARCSFLLSLKKFSRFTDGQSLTDIFCAHNTKMTTQTLQVHKSPQNFAVHTTQQYKSNICLDSHMKICPNKHGFFEMVCPDCGCFPNAVLCKICGNIHQKNEEIQECFSNARIDQISVEEWKGKTYKENDEVFLYTSSLTEWLQTKFNNKSISLNWHHWLVHLDTPLYWSCNDKVSLVETHRTDEECCIETCTQNTIETRPYLNQKVFPASMPSNDRYFSYALKHDFTTNFKSCFTLLKNKDTRQFLYIEYKSTTKHHNLLAACTKVGLEKWYGPLMQLGISSLAELRYLATYSSVRALIPRKVLQDLCKIAGREKQRKYSWFDLIANATSTFLNAKTFSCVPIYVSMQPSK